MLVDGLRKDISDLRQENSELKRSLEFTQHELSEAKKCINSHEDKLRNMEPEFELGKQNAGKIRQLEDFSRRHNLVLDGLPTIHGENNEKLQQHVTKIFEEKLNISPHLDVVHRLGRSGRTRLKGEQFCCAFSQCTNVMHACDQLPGLKEQIFTLMMMYPRQRMRFARVNYMS